MARRLRLATPQLSRATHATGSCVLGLGILRRAARSERAGAAGPRTVTAETSAPEVGGPGRVGENPGVKVDVERGAWMCASAATLPQVGAATVAARATVAPGQWSTERRALRLLVL